MEYTHHSEKIEITLTGTPAAIKATIIWLHNHSLSVISQDFDPAQGQTTIVAKAPRPRKTSAGLRNYITCYLCGKSRHVNQPICPCGQDAPT